jgi:hypothetical protein
MSTPEPDYSKARQWLRDEGYGRDELETPEQLRAAAASLEAEARRRSELARDVAAEMKLAEAVAGMRGALRGVLARGGNCA